MQLNWADKWSKYTKPLILLQNYLQQCVYLLLAIIRKQLPDDSSVFWNSQISLTDVAQLGRQVVQISKTTHLVAKLDTPMCFPLLAIILPDDFRK